MSYLPVISPVQANLRKFLDGINSKFSIEYYETTFPIDIDIRRIESFIKRLRQYDQAWINLINEMVEGNRQNDQISLYIKTSRGPSGYIKLIDEALDMKSFLESLRLAVLEYTLSLSPVEQRIKSKQAIDEAFKDLFLPPNNDPTEKALIVDSKSPSCDQKTFSSSFSQVCQPSNQIQCYSATTPTVLASPTVAPPNKADQNVQNSFATVHQPEAFPDNQSKSNSTLLVTSPSFTGIPKSSCHTPYSESHTIKTTTISADIKCNTDQNINPSPTVYQKDHLLASTPDFLPLNNDQNDQQPTTETSKQSDELIVKTNPPDINPPDQMVLPIPIHGNLPHFDDPPNQKLLAPDDVPHSETTTSDINSVIERAYYQLLDTLINRRKLFMINPNQLKEHIKGHICFIKPQKSSKIMMKDVRWIKNHYDAFWQPTNYTSSNYGFEKGSMPSYCSNHSFTPPLTNINDPDYMKLFNAPNYSHSLYLLYFN